ncbi:DUF3679 domain-containing protein [Bacillus marinisedimentorum]|uniref:DUF3679 domain-containing protein n=1 Tax=Bacillus marinisedimentorum TaxID=1821260 RepID=UPI00087274A8|nr:DUF3679 domain-containing protein [Bacillus marinisedimentorum]
MANFMLKTLFMISVLLVGVLIGMQQANDGMRNMKGFENSFSGAFEISEADDGKMEAEVLGQSITRQDLREKQEKLEKAEAFNVFSSMGAKLADAAGTAFRWMFNAMSMVLGKLLGFIVPFNFWT